jgi:hypothetical protein
MPDDGDVEVVVLSIQDRCYTEEGKQLAYCNIVLLSGLTRFATLYRFHPQAFIANLAKSLFASAIDI